MNLLLIYGANPEALDAAGRRPQEVLPLGFWDLRLALPHVRPHPALLQHTPMAFPPPALPLSPVLFPAVELPPVGDEEVVVDEQTLSSSAFQMYEFKVRRCPNSRSHDWMTCPFTHPGEKAARRDPRKVAYSANACPDFRKGFCRLGDACSNAHGVFECWLHPQRYRTQACKDGALCSRRVCFFFHSPAEERTPGQPAEPLAPPPAAAAAPAAPASAAPLSLGRPPLLIRTSVAQPAGDKRSPHARSASDDLSLAALAASASAISLSSEDADARVAKAETRLAEARALQIKARAQAGLAAPRSQSAPVSPRSPQPGAGAGGAFETVSTLLPPVARAAAPEAARQDERASPMTRPSSFAHLGMVEGLL